MKKNPVGRPRTKTGRDAPIIAARVSEAQKKRIAAYCAKHGTSEQALIRERLRDVLGPE